MWLNESYEAIHDKALHLVQEGKLEEAIAEYRRGVERLLRISPDTLRRQGKTLEMLQHIALELAHTLQRVGRYDEAIELVNRIGDLLPELQTGWKREAARFKVMKGDVDGAVTDLQALLQQHPGDAYLYTAYAEALAAGGAFDQAREAVIRAIDLTPAREQKAIGYGVLGEIHMRAGNLREMMRAWEMAAGLRPEGDTFLPFGYDLFFRSGRIDEARAYIERDPDLVRRALYLGIANQLQGDRRGAEAQWRRAFRQKPDEKTRDIGLWAEAGLRLGQPAPVVDELLPKLSAGQASTGVALLTAIGLAMLGERDRAEELFAGVSHDLLASRGQSLLPRGAWAMLDSLVADAAVKDSLRKYFEPEPVQPAVVPEEQAVETQAPLPDEPQDEPAGEMPAAASEEA